MLIFTIFDVADDLVDLPDAPFLGFDENSFSGVSLKNHEGTR